MGQQVSVPAHASHSGSHSAAEEIMTHEQEKKPGDEVKPGTNQSGENLCPTCAGEGKVDNKPCPNCAGTGTVTTLIGDA